MGYVKTLQQALLRRQSKPKLKPRDVIISQFIEESNTVKSQHYQSKKSLFKDSTISRIDSTSASHCCAAAINELKPVRLKELFANKVHFGGVLYCRVVSKVHCKNISNISVIVQDEDNNACKLVLYNLESQLQCASDIEQDILQFDSLIAIAEPYFKQFDHKEGKDFG